MTAPTSDNPFDKAGRYAAKLDPPVFFKWLFWGDRPQLTFRGWLDTRTLPFPGEPDRTRDTVGHLERSDDPVPVACVVEIESGRRGKKLERLAEYVIRGRREWRHGKNRRGVYDAISALINLKGRSRRRELRMVVGDAELTFRPKIRDMAAEQAAATLDQIRRGELGRCMLAWIPLMSGGGEEPIIKQWKQLARREPNDQRRAEYAALALVFAELAGCYDAWSRALKGWNMIQSKQVLEWMEEGRVEGVRDKLVLLVESRFAKVPKSFVKRVQATDDLKTLNAWFKAALDAPDWNSFAKSVNGG